MKKKVNESSLRNFKVLHLYRLAGIEDIESLFFVYLLPTTLVLCSILCERAGLLGRWIKRQHFRGTWESNVTYLLTTSELWGCDLKPPLPNKN